MSELSEKKIKAIKKEGGKKGQDLEGMAAMGSLFQQAMLQEPDGVMSSLEMALEAMNKEVDPDGEERRGGAGGVAKILISADKDAKENLCIIVHVPEQFTAADKNERQYEISAADWLTAALANLPGDGKGAEISESSATMAKCTYKNDPENGRFVLKAKDAVSGASFAFLRSKSLVCDDDDSDEMIFGDDDMPGCGDDEE